MTSAYIDIGTATRQSGETRSAISQLQNVVDEFDRLKSMFDQAALGEDWVALGALLNIAPADAQIVYNLWGSAVTELHATFITQLLGRCA